MTSEFVVKEASFNQSDRSCPLALQMSPRQLLGLILGAALWKPPSSVLPFVACPNTPIAAAGSLLEQGDSEQFHHVFWQHIFHDELV